MAADWYFRDESNGEVRGPISAKVLRELARGGRLTRASMVSQSFDGPWLSATRVKGLLPSTEGSESDNGLVHALGARGDCDATVNTSAASIDDDAVSRWLSDAETATTDEIPVSADQAFDQPAGDSIGEALPEACCESTADSESAPTSVPRRTGWTIAAAVGGVVAISGGAIVAFLATRGGNDSKLNDVSPQIASNAGESNDDDDELEKLKREVAELKRKHEAANRESAAGAAPDATPAANGAANKDTTRPLPDGATNENTSSSESRSGKLANGDGKGPTTLAPAEEEARLLAERPSIVEVVKRVRKSLVYVEAMLAVGNDTRSGSGFVVHPSGLIVTNYHVVDGAASVTVTLDGGKKAAVAGWASYRRGADLVLLKVYLPNAEAPDAALIPMEISAEDAPQGADVYTLGAPLGQRETLTRGIVRALRKGREIPFANTLDPNSTWLQTTTQLARGNSGGPLFDGTGKLVGVNTSAWLTDPNAGNVPFNYAVAASEVRALIANAKPKATVFSMVAAPAATDVADNAKTGAASPEVAKEWQQREEQRSATVKQVYDKWLGLFDKWQAVQQRVAATQDEVKTAKTNYDRANASARAAQASGANIRRDYDRLQLELNRTKDKFAAERLRDRVQALEAEFRDWDRRYREAAAERDAAATTGRNLQARMQSEQKEGAKLRGDADKLDPEWLSQTDPFGRLPTAAHERAVTTYSQWIARNDKHAVLYVLRADAYTNLKKYDAALADFNKSIAIAPMSSAYALRGWAYQKSGDPRKAMADFGKALTLSSTNAYAYAFKALNEAQKKEYSLAARDFGTALQNAPKNPEFQRLQAFFLATCPNDGQRKGAKALSLAQEANRTTLERDWACLDALAAALAETGDFAAAAKRAQAAAERCPHEERQAILARAALYLAKKPYRVE